MFAVKVAGWVPASVTFRWGPLPGWRPALVRVEGERLLVKGTVMAFLRGPLGYALPLTSIRRADVSFDGRTIELRWRVRRVRLSTTGAAIHELAMQLRARGVPVQDAADQSGNAPR